MKTHVKKVLVCIMTFWCFLSPTLAGSWSSWHKPFNVATLAPIYEPQIWQTNCERLNDQKADEIVELLERETIIPITSSEYLMNSNIRVILFSIDEIYHINQNFQFKKILPNKIQYFKLNSQSQFKEILKANFNQCKVNLAK